MLRKLVTLSIIAMLAATAFGAAASLTFDGGTIQFGVDDTLKCDPDGVQVQYEIGHTGTMGSFSLIEIYISGIDQACFGNTLGWALGDGAGTIIDTDFWGINGPELWIPVSIPAVDVENIEVLKLWITGTNSLP